MKTKAETAFQIKVFLGAVFIFFNRLFFGFSKVDLINVIQKVYSEPNAEGKTVLLTRCEYKALLSALSYKGFPSSIFERNADGSLFEIKIEN